MKTALVLLAACSITLACGKDEDKSANPGEADKGDQQQPAETPAAGLPGEKLPADLEKALAGAAKVADEMCACKDAACATGTTEKWMVPAYTVKGGLDDSKLSPKQVEAGTKRMTEIATRLSDCHKKLVR